MLITALNYVQDKISGRTNELSYDSDEKPITNLKINNTGKPRNITV